MLRLYVEIYASVNESLRTFLAIDARWHAGSRDAAAEQFPHPTSLGKLRLRRFGKACRFGKASRFEKTFDPAIEMIYRRNQGDQTLTIFAPLPTAPGHAKRCSAMFLYNRQGGRCRFCATSQVPARPMSLCRSWRAQLWKPSVCHFPVFPTLPGCLKTISIILTA
jgi:hypothetical protein